MSTKVKKILTPEEKAAKKLASEERKAKRTPEQQAAINERMAKVRASKGVKKALESSVKAEGELADKKPESTSEVNIGVQLVDLI